VAGDSAYVSLFIVIIFHQAFEGLALGSRIAELTDSTLPQKFVMALVFALITPLGMAIGLGVINTFNGNNPGTILAMGTLDALSAGILTWSALVDMLSHDWIYGDMKDAPVGRTIVGIAALILGMALMGLLGKWA
jgi:zinc transporter 1/2/3